MGIAAIGNVMESTGRIFTSTDGVSRLLSLFKSIFDGILLNGGRHPSLALMRDHFKLIGHTIAGLTYLPRSILGFFKTERGDFVVLQENFLRLCNRIAILITSVCLSLQLADHFELLDLTAASITFGEYASKIGLASTLIAGLSLGFIIDCASIVGSICLLIDTGRALLDPANQEVAKKALDMTGAAAKIILVVFAEKWKKTFTLVAFSILYALIGLTKIVVHT